MGKLTWKLKSVHKTYFYSIVSLKWIFWPQGQGSTNVFDHTQVAQMFPWCGHTDQHICVYDADIQTSKIMSIMGTCGPAQLRSWWRHSTSTIAFMMRTRGLAQMCQWCGYADQHKCEHAASTMLAMRDVNLNICKINLNLCKIYLNLCKLNVCNCHLRLCKNLPDFI